MAGWIWRGAVAVSALLILCAVFTTAEYARPEGSTIGHIMGVESREVVLTRAIDAMATGSAAPTAADIALARKAAMSEPLSPLSFYILGASGHASDARAAITMALQRDPRFLPGYRWRAATLARAGDIAGATRALILIGILSPTDERIWPVIASLTADPRARRVIKGEIARSAAWRSIYVAYLSASSVDRAIVYEMLQTAGKPAPAPSSGQEPPLEHERRDFIAAMVSRKEYERAYLAWVQWLPRASLAGTGNVFDSQFKGLVALPPFSWSLDDGAGGATAIDPAVGLTLDYSGSDEAILVQQMVLLPPGRYRIVTDAHFDATGSDGGAPLLAWTLACVADQRALSTLAVPLVGTPRRVAAAPFAVDAQCAAQMLTLHVSPSDFAKRVSGHIRSVEIETVPA